MHVPHSGPQCPATQPSLALPVPEAAAQSSLSLESVAVPPTPGGYKTKAAFKKGLRRRLWARVAARRGPHTGAGADNRSLPTRLLSFAVWPHQLETKKGYVTRNRRKTKITPGVTKPAPFLRRYAPNEIPYTNAIAAMAIGAHPLPFGLVGATPRCHCGGAAATRDHLLLDCPRLAEQRAAFVTSVTGERWPGHAWHGWTREQQHRAIIAGPWPEDKGPQRLSAHAHWRTFLRAAARLCKAVIDDLGGLR